MDKPKVSILVPVYGVEKFIARCAESLFRQTYKNIEFIFVNDCTKDGSIDALKKTIQKFPQREYQINIINHEKNCGLAASRNTAVAYASGEFLMHVDSDDYVDKHIVEETVKIQLETNADIVSCNAIRLRQGITERISHKEYSSTKENCLAVISRDDEVCVWGRLIRTSLYKDNCIRTEQGINMAEDYQVIGRLMFYANKTVVLNQFLYFYDCTNEGSYSNNFSIEKNRQSWRSFDIVKDFFHDKGKEYVDATYKGEINIIVSHLIMSGKISNGKYYYEEARNRLKFIERKYWKCVPLERRMVLYLSSNFFIMRMYTQLSRYIKYLFKANLRSDKE